MNTLQIMYLLIKVITLIFAFIGAIKIKQNKQNEISDICVKFLLLTVLGILSTSTLSILIIFEINVEIFIKSLPVIGFLFLGFASLNLSKFSIIVFYDNLTDYNTKYVKIPYALFIILSFTSIIGLFISEVLIYIGMVFVLLTLITYIILFINLVKLSSKIKKENIDINNDLKKFENTKNKKDDENLMSRLNGNMKAIKKMNFISFGSIFMIFNIIFNIMDSLTRSSAFNDPTIYGWIAWVLCFMSLYSFAEGFKK